MIRLPLFPLNMVLFPGMPVSLHIFEERYKQMVRECLDRNQPFGVVLIQNGSEAFGPPAEPYRVGCTAEITQVQPLAEGRMNLIAIGRDRFVIRSLDYSAAYLVASAELMPFSPTSDVQTTSLVESLAETLRPWVQRYLRSLGEVDNLSVEVQDLPTESKPFAFLASFLLQVPMEEKQQLLESADLTALLTALTVLYRREVTLVRAMITHQSEAKTPFSLN